MDNHKGTWERITYNNKALNWIIKWFNARKFSLNISIKNIKYFKRRKKQGKESKD